MFVQEKISPETNVASENKFIGAKKDKKKYL